jgi:hypothetical protein
LYVFIYNVFSFTPLIPYFFGEPSTNHKWEYSFLFLLSNGIMLGIVNWFIFKVEKIEIAKYNFLVSNKTLTLTVIRGH